MMKTVKTILDEADIQLISMQIRYVLRIQKAIQPINNYFSFNIMRGVLFFSFSFEKKQGSI